MLTFRRTVVSLALTVSLAARAVAAQAGTVDTSFQVGTGFVGQPWCVKLDSQGRVLVGGDFTSYNSTPRTRLVRILGNGSIDTSFNPGTGPNGIVLGIEEQPDGKLLVVGGFSLYQNVACRGVIRVLSNGSPDQTFQPVIVQTVPPTFALALQPDGSTVFGGTFSWFGGAVHERLVRLSSTGAVDSTFNPAANSDVYALALQPDGRILAGGIFTSLSGVSRQRIGRFEPTGALDTSFVGLANEEVDSIAVQPDGKIVIGGFFTAYGGTFAGRVARLMPDGQLDTSFQSNPGANGAVWSVALDGTGSMLIGGAFTQVGGVPRSRLARLGADGTLDTAFVSNPGANGTVLDIAVQANGSAVIVGNFTSYGSATRPGIARVIGGNICYLEGDGDGYGTGAGTFSVGACGAGYSAFNGDCNDSNASIFPGAPELCDGIDNDCDGSIDEGLTAIWYLDADGDGFGVTAQSIVSCTPVLGYAPLSGDCNDSNASIFPGAPEVCDGIDNDCDGPIDEGLIANWYPDLDQDGYGVTAQVLATCNPPSGFVLVGGDCNDSNASVFPGAPELCDGLDNNCNVVIDEVLLESYCTPGTSYAGCVATMSGAGVPSSSSGSGFQLMASGAPGQRLGLFYYGFQPGYIAVSIDSTSSFCVLPPYQRMSTVISSGTLGQCDGVLSIDFNQWLQANPAALGSPLLPGTVIYAQAWYRDPRVRDRANLSDGLKFTICN